MFLFKKKFLIQFCIYCLFLSQFDSCASKTENISETVLIRLDQFISDSIPFLPEYNIVKFVTKQDADVKILDSIETGVIIFQQGISDTIKSLKNKILVMRGINEGRRSLIFDSNNDGIIAIENKYDLENLSGFIKIDNVDIKFADISYTMPLYVQPQTSGEFLNFKLSKEELGVRILPIYRHGIFKTNAEDTFKLALFNHFIESYTSKNSSLIVVPYQNKFTSMHPVQYKVGDTIYLNKEVYLFKSVSKSGDIVEFKHLDKLDKNFGVEEGDFALIIKSIDIRNGGFYEIGSSKKYTLMDFWGTWCLPCIKLTDSLKQLNQTFSDKDFELVSIAFDDSVEAVNRYLTKHNIEWVNLFDEAKNSILSSKFKVNDFPTFILLDKKGEIVIRGVGEETLKRIQAYLKINL
jgi:thiol-disulfide isomerase/thioredoxin